MISKNHKQTNKQTYLWFWLINSWSSAKLIFILSWSTDDHQLIISCSNVGHVVIIPVYLQKEKRRNKQTNQQIFNIWRSSVDHQLIIIWPTVDHHSCVSKQRKEKEKRKNSHTSYICWPTVDNQFINCWSSVYQRYNHQLIISWSTVDHEVIIPVYVNCLLYTSDAADE